MFGIKFHLSLPPCQMVQFKNLCTSWHSNLSMWGVYIGYQAKISTQEQLQMAHLIFTIFNSHITVVHLKFIKSIYCYGLK